MEVTIRNPATDAYEILSPRYHLASSGFAIKAKDADTVDGMHASELGTGDGHSLDGANGGPTDAVYVDDVGNVGIGTISPNQLLTVSENTGGVSIGQPGSESNIRLTIDPIESNEGQLYFRVLRTTNKIGRIFTSGAVDGGIILGHTSTANDLFIDGDNGNVGIGTTGPAVKLDIATDGGALRLTDIDSALSDGEDASSLEFANSDSDSSGGVSARIRAVGKGSIGYTSLAFQVGQAGGTLVDALRIEGTSGNVGIGTTNPSEKLDVAGTVKATAFVGDGSELTNISGIADSDWVESGGNVYREVGNVGIGTMNPGYKLEAYDGSNSIVAKFKGAASDGGILLGHYAVAQGNIDVDNGYKRVLFGEGAYWDIINKRYQLTNARYDRAGMEILNGGHIGFFSELSDRSVTGNMSLAEWNAIERMRITNNGNVGIGTTDPTAIATKSIFTVEGDGRHGQITAITHKDQDPCGVMKIFGSRGSQENPIPLQDNDRFGLILAHGYTGRSDSDSQPYHRGASIEFRVDGVVDVNNLPSEILFYTRAYGEEYRSNRMVINSTGNVGIGTTSPDSRLHVNGHIRIEGDWNFLQLKETDSNPNENFCIGVNDGLLRFNTADDNLSNGLSRMVIDQSGNVGIGTTSPSERLEVAGHIQLSGGTNRRIVSSSGDLEIQATQPNGEGDVRVELTEGNRFAVRDGTVDLMTVQRTGNIGIGTTSPQGKLDVNGAIYQRGVSLHADYVFEPGYRLESINEHAEFMWENKHLKAIPKATADRNGQEIIEVGAHRKGIVEELEKAHIYIEQLHKHITVIEERNRKIVERNKEMDKHNKEIEGRLAKLEAMLLNNTQQ